MRSRLREWLKKFWRSEIGVCPYCREKIYIPFCDHFLVCRECRLDRGSGPAR